MNQPSAPISPQPPTPSASPEDVSGGGIIQSYEERAAAVFGDDDGSGGESPVTTPDGSAALPLDEVAQRRAERRKQLDATIAEETQRVDAQQRRKNADEATRRAAVAERERDELRQQLAGRVDPTSLDEAGFFALAQQLKVTPKALGEWLKQKQENPEYIAAQAAERAVDPKLSALERRIAEQDEKLAAFEAAQTQERTQNVAMARGDSMLNFTQASAAQAPHAARFLESYGEERFIQMALTAMPDKSFRPGWEQHTLDAIENHLADFARIYSPQSGAPQQRQAPPPPKTGAAKPMTTVSNTLAQSRASVVPDGVDYAALSYDERARRVFGDD